MDRLKSDLPRISRLRFGIPLAAAVGLPGLAFGDTAGHTGFSEGLLHPVLGLDHLLAMLSVGILGARAGGRASWTVPASFVGVMLFGGLLGMSGARLPAVEDGIAVSVVALGVCLAVEHKLPQLRAMILVSCFGLFHGLAHGTEIPDLATPVFYALGFIAGTAGLHAVGVLGGTVARRVPGGAGMLRFIGAGVAGAGLYIFVGA